MKQYTGRTLDEVLGSIAQEQGCSVNDITYNIIDEEKGGIFGIHKSVTVEAFTSQDVKEFIFDYLGSYFTELNQQVSIEIIVERSKEKGKEGELAYKVIIDAEENADFIGKGGHTILAIASVVRAAVATTFKKRIDVSADINHYLERRYKRLKNLAKKEAINVLKTHIDVALDPMPNNERKVIHQYLQDFKGIVTESEGEAYERHICIKYVGKQNKKQEASTSNSEESNSQETNTETEA